MDCEHAQDLMNLCLDAELPEYESADFYEHLSSCTKCAREYAELSRLMHELRQPVQMPASPYWDRIWREVHHRLRRPTEPKHPLLRLRPVFAAVIGLMVIATGVSHKLHAPRVAAELPAAETTSQHAMVMMHHPYTEPGLVLFAMSEGTLASYNERNNGTN